MGQAGEARLQAEHPLVPPPQEAALGKGYCERFVMWWGRVPPGFGTVFRVSSRSALHAASWARSVPSPATGDPHGAGLCAALCQALGGTVPGDTLSA